mmetsp:Transcript_18479/g.60659  ORF Transcript_18479/g.60659 Transcript_18479/m.60659 type:complete len:240 (-) Transcript_18479:40-759(-)
MCGFFPTFSQHQRHQHLHPGIQRRPASVLQDVGSRELPADPDQVWFSKESQVVRAVWGWLLLLRALLLVPSKSGECTVLRCSRETTYSESYDEESATKAVQNSDNKETASEEPEEVDAEEASLRYRVLQALVGTKRLDELELEIRDKVLQRMAGGAGQLLKSFKLFSSGKGEIGPNQLMSVCQDLGVDISRREATALFGRFDINKDGGIVYYEFVDALLQKDVSPGIKRNASYYDKRTK